MDIHKNLDLLSYLNSSEIIRRCNDCLTYYQHEDRRVQTIHVNGFFGDTNIKGAFTSE
jgi:hypothetical protein